VPDHYNGSQQRPGNRVTATTVTTDLSNHFLLAMPNMADPNFSGAVVLIAEHNGRGALGLVLNSPPP